MTRRLGFWGWFWLVFGAAYFMIPLAATTEFSLNEGDDYGFGPYRELLEDPMFRDTLWQSFRLSVYTIAVSLVLFIPTV